MFVIFDFFGTLVDYEISNPVESFETSLPLLRRAGYQGDARALHALWQDVYGELLADSLRTLDEFPFEQACAKALQGLPGISVARAEDADLCAEFMQALLASWNEKVRLIEGVDAMLQQLQSEHTLALISNTHHAPLVHGNLARFGLADYFSQVLTSVEHGKRKPSAEIFQTAMQCLGARARQCLFVGDNPLDDHAGATGAGMRALLIDPQGRHTHIPSTDRIAHVLSVSARVCA